MVTVVPSGPEANLSCPPWCSIMFLEMFNPRPVPNLGGEKGVDTFPEVLGVCASGILDRNHKSCSSSS